MNETTTVRDATPDDVDTLVEFNLAMAEETEDKHLDPDRLRRGIVAVFERPERGRYLVVVAGGRVVGALLLTREWSDWRNGEFWWIQSVYVRPDARRRGHFRRLYAHAKQLAFEDPRVCGLRLYVEAENATAQRTYTALGMHETTYRMFELER